MKDFFLPLGGGNEIGASCYLLCVGGARIMLDAGIRLNAQRAYPDFARLTAAVGGMTELSAVLLSHAHLDHCGAMTRVHHEGPCVSKYATRPTVELARVMLCDALRISTTQRSEDWSLRETSRQQLVEMLDSFQCVEFGKEFDIGGKVAVTPYQAGHILGATAFLIEVGGKRIFFTGDISVHAQRTISGLNINSLPEGVDYLIMESTYAYQPQYHDETIAEQQFALVQAVTSIVQDGGRVLIPAFAVGRAQEIACLFHDYFEQGLINSFPVILDGLVKAICEVYDAHRTYLQGRLQTRSGHVIYGDFVRPTDDAYYPTKSGVGALEPGCVISSSGMLMDGTRSARYAEFLAPNQRDAILFSGYLDDESPGKRLLALQSGGGRIRLNGREVQVQSHIGRYHLSAHAPASGLTQVISKMKPRNVILVHGDYRFQGDAEFIGFIMALRKDGVLVHQSANGVPFYL